MAARSTLWKTKNLINQISRSEVLFCGTCRQGRRRRNPLYFKTFSFLLLAWNIICRHFSFMLVFYYTWCGQKHFFFPSALAFPKPKQLRDADRVGKTQGLWLTVKADVIATSVPRKAAVWSAFCLQDFWDSRSRSGADKTCPLRFWKASAQIVKLFLIRPTGNTSPLAQPNWYHC